MGIYCKLFSISQANAERIQNEPTGEWYFNSEKRNIVRCVPRQQSFLSKLMGKRPESDEQDWISLSAEKNEGREIDINQAWGALQFILEQLTPPVDFIEAEGTLLPGDSGLDPSRYFTATAVRSYAKTLDSVSPERFEALYDPAALQANVSYPSWDDWDGEAKDDLCEYFAELRDFVLWCRDKEVDFIVSFC